MNSANSIIAKKNIEKVKSFIKEIIDSRKNDSSVSSDTGAEDLANIVLYAIGVVLSDNSLIKTFDLIVNPETATPIGTPCGVAIEKLTKE